MASAPPDPNAPQPVILNSFKGLKNTVNPERLTAAELEIAKNIDIDEAGQIRRRRGYTLKIAGKCHSTRTLAGKTYMVKDGILGIVRPDYSFTSLYGVGDVPVCYTEVNGDVYFSGAVSGVITSEEEYIPWGHTDGQGTWYSPVYTPTDTLGEVGGSLLGDPPKATQLDNYKGRIYLANGKLLWATELWRYHYVDRTRNFMQFEEDITMIAAMTDGLFVGTKGGVYFLQGIFGAFKVNQMSPYGVLPGSLVRVQSALVHPQIRQTPVAESQSAIFMTTAGVMGGFDGGECYNLSQGYGEEWNRVIFPDAQQAAALYRQDSGDNSYVAVLDSEGGPSANARIGDFVDAEIIRFGG